MDPISLSAVQIPILKQEPPSLPTRPSLPIRPSSPPLSTRPHPLLRRPTLPLEHPPSIPIRQDSSLEFTPEEKPDLPELPETPNPLRDILKILRQDPSLEFTPEEENILLILQEQGAPSPLLKLEYLKEVRKFISQRTGLVQEMDPPHYKASKKMVEIRFDPELLKIAKTRIKKEKDTYIEPLPFHVNVVCLLISPLSPDPKERAKELKMKKEIVMTCIERSSRNLIKLAKSIVRNLIEELKEKTDEDKCLRFQEKFTQLINTVTQLSDDLFKRLKTLFSDLEFPLPKLKMPFSNSDSDGLFPLYLKICSHIKKGENPAQTTLDFCDAFFKAWAQVSKKANMESFDACFNELSINK